MPPTADPRLTHPYLRTPHRAALMAALFAAVLFLPFLGSFPVCDADEGQRFLPPLEMLNHGGILVPTLNGMEYLKKPPLLYWQTIPFYAVMGPNEWSARIHVALMGIALVAVTVLWAGTFTAPATAFLAGIICAGNYVVISQSRICQLNTPLALFTLGAMWAWCSALKHHIAGRPGFRAAVFWGAAWLAVAHLYKFPVPLIFLIPSLAGAAIAMGHWRALFRWEWWAALLVSTVPIALWAIAAAASVGWGAAREIWAREAHLHLVEATEINSGPVWFYLVRVPVMFLPWTLLAFWWTRPDFWRSQRHRPVELHFLWTGLAVSMTFLSLNTSKETKYMICAVPAIAILLAWAWEHASAPGQWLARRQGREPVRVLFAAALVYALLAVPGFYAFDVHYANRRNGHETKNLGQRLHRDTRPIALHRIGSKPDFLFYVARRLPEIVRVRDIAGWFDEHPGGILVIRSTVYEDFKDHPAFAGLEVEEQLPRKANLSVLRRAGPAAAPAAAPAGEPEAPAEP